MNVKMSGGAHHAHETKITVIVYGLFTFCMEPKLPVEGSQKVYQLVHDQGISKFIEMTTMQKSAIHIEICWKCISKRPNK